jgi:hypothetical protein
MGTDNMKPRVFVGSSTEGRKFAYALQENLENDAVVTVWDQDIFRATEYVLQSLLKALDVTDIGVFVFSPDDEAKIRGRKTAAVRDNVIFETGLYVGRLGPNRSIVVRPESKDMKMHIPSDLKGVNTVPFNPNRPDGNFKAALGPAANQIRRIIEDSETSSLPPRTALTRNDVKLLHSATQPRYPSHTASLCFGEPKKWDNELCMRFVHLVHLGLLQPCGSTEVQISSKGKAFLASYGPIQASSPNSSKR